MIGKRLIICLVLIGLFLCCNTKDQDSLNIISITNPNEQDSLFQDVLSLTDNTITENKQKDSLAFLVLPVEAACPACRKKAIDSIDNHKRQLDVNHFVIVSGTGGRIIRSFFIEQGRELPSIEGKIFIDSTNEAFVRGLIFSKPTIFYSFDKKVYKKITCVPTNVKNELHKFFTNHPVNNHLVKVE